MLRIKIHTVLAPGVFKTVFVRRNGGRTGLNKGKVRMLFYTAIFIVCLIAAIIIPWLYRLISGAGKVVQQTVLPRAKNGPTNHVETNQVSLSNTDTSSPWDLVSHHAPRALARVRARQAEAEHAIGESNSYYGPRNVYSAPLCTETDMPSAGWIQREDRPTPNGASYKVTRRVRTREQNPKAVRKPSNW